jgi:hypothetical protein
MSALFSPITLRNLILPMRPVESAGRIPNSKVGWEAFAPSAVPQKDGEVPPRALDTGLWHSAAQSGGQRFAPPPYWHAPQREHKDLFGEIINGGR